MRRLLSAVKRSLRGAKRSSARVADESALEGAGGRQDGRGGEDGGRRARRGGWQGLSATLVAVVCAPLELVSCLVGQAELAAGAASDMSDRMVDDGMRYAIYL